MPATLTENSTEEGRMQGEKMVSLCCTCQAGIKDSAAYMHAPQRDTRTRDVCRQFYVRTLLLRFDLPSACSAFLPLLWKVGFGGW